MPISRGPGLPCHNTHHKQGPTPHALHNPLSPNTQIAASCTRASLASHLPGWWWAGSGWQRTMIASTFLFLCLACRRAAFPSDARRRHITFLSSTFLSTTTSTSFLVISGLTSHLTNHTLPVAQPLTSHPIHQQFTAFRCSFSTLVVLFIDQCIQLAARHGHQLNRRYLRAPI